MKDKSICMLGTGFIADFYADTLHSQRTHDRIVAVYGRSAEKAKSFADKWSVPFWSDNMEDAVQREEVDTVIIGLSNDMHLPAVRAAAAAGKAVLCTKPLGRTAEEAREMLALVEEAGVFAGYLEDLVYTHKTLKALKSVKNGALGDVLWVRSRETHPGPHSDWFWDAARSGGGAIVDMGCHCIEIARNFIGKEVRPLEVMCWADTQVKPIEAEDHGIGLVKYENGAIGQFEVSWTFRGGMDLRDEVSGVEGTIRLDHFLRTGFETFTAVGEGGYVAEKAEQDTGWLFPVGDEVGALGYDNMFADMFNAMDEEAPPMETFYDGYVVNAIMDACYLSAKTKKWEPVMLDDWRGAKTEKRSAGLVEYDDDYYLMKRERMPNGTQKVILKHKTSGEIVQKTLE